MWTILHRLFAWVIRTDASDLSVAGTAGLPSGSWHGDHWQNLLCSPMDARHYVMEDWTVLPELESAAPSPSGRRR
ncbi:MAG TPA: hypothetical protein VGM85_17755 [Paraburkholderia sp.]|jgi:hypothetical protein